MASPQNILLAPKSLLADLLNNRLQEMEPLLHLNQVDKALMERKEKYIFLPNDMWVRLNGEIRPINRGQDINGNPIPIEPDHSRPARSAYLYDINSKSWQLSPGPKGFVLRIELETDGNEIKGWRRRGKAKRRDKWAADGNIKAPKGSDSPFIEIDISESVLTDDKASLGKLSKDDIRVGMKFDGNGFLGFLDKFLDLFTFSQFDLEDSITNKIQGKIINAILGSAEDLFFELSSIGDTLIRKKSFKLSSSLSVSNLEFQGDRAILSLTDSTDSNVGNVFSYFSHSLSYRHHNLYLMGDENIDGTGNRRNNKITGNNGENVIKGYEGKDLIFGKGGDDRVSGGSGDDRVSGGSGDDRVSGGSGDDRVSGGSGDDRVLGDSGSDEVFGNSGNDKVFGGSGHDEVSGGAGNDSLFGGAGNDLLRGGSGVDIMSGGSGNDRYKVDKSEDLVVERANAGNDRVMSSADYVLGDNIEDLTLTGTAVLGSGNALDNRLIGNHHNNIFYADAGDDYVNGQAGDDVAYGGDGDDVIAGFMGKDKLAGQAGNDTLDGGYFYYTYQYPSELAIYQTYLALGLFVPMPEIPDSESRVLDGGEDDDRLYGGSGHDTLIGGTGNDTMFGWTGNDLYYVDSTNDQVIEAEQSGTDEVRAFINYSLTENVENLRLEGTVYHGIGNSLNNTIHGNNSHNLIEGLAGNDRLFGHDGDDQLHGGVGNDYLNGNAGDDTMYGGAGNDEYIVSSAADQVIELADQGVDVIYSYIDYTLPDHIENVMMRESAYYGQGNELDNTIRGNNSQNLIEGMSGNDMLHGYGDDDIISGGLGNDEIFGGDGDDLIRGDLNRRDTQDEINGGDDLLHGGKGNDRIGGKSGNDTLFGDEGNDQIWGDDGDDILNGGLNDDTLTGDDFSGGQGSDIFVLASDHGTDTITDFEIGTDRIGLIGELSYGQLILSQSGKNTTISFGEETLAILNKVNAIDLSEADFLANFVPTV